MNTKVVFDEKKKAYAAYDNGKLLGYYRSEADAKDAIEFNRTTARLSAHVGLAGSDFARDLKEMMDAWDKYRAIWIKKHGNDEGFAKWYKEQIAGLEKKAKSSPPQFKDAGANDKQESNKDFMKRIGSRRNGYSAKTASTSLSAICDRELARVGLANSDLFDKMARYAYEKGGVSNVLGDSRFEQWMRQLVVSGGHGAEHEIRVDLIKAVREMEKADGMGY